MKIPHLKSTWWSPSPQAEKGLRLTLYSLVKPSVSMWDVKVVLGENIIKQRHLLVCDFHADIHPPAKKKFIPRLRTWRLREPNALWENQKAFIRETTSSYASGCGTCQTFRFGSYQRHWLCADIVLILTACFRDHDDVTECTLTPVIQNPKSKYRVVYWHHFYDVGCFGRCRCWHFGQQLRYFHFTCAVRCHIL